MLDHSSFGFLSLLNRLKWNDLVTVSCQCKLVQVKGYELTHHSPGASICPCCTMLIALMIIVSFTLMSLKAEAVERTVKLDLSKDGSWRSQWWNENEDENNFYFIYLFIYCWVLWDKDLCVKNTAVFSAVPSCLNSSRLNWSEHKLWGESFWQLAEIFLLLDIYQERLTHYIFFPLSLYGFFSVVFSKKSWSVQQRPVQEPVH